MSDAVRSSRRLDDAAGPGYFTPADDRRRMGSRDPLGGSNVTTGEGYDPGGGPLGVVAGAVAFLVVAVLLVVVVSGLEAVFAAVLPSVLVLPAVLLAAAGLVVAAVYGVLRANTWRRRR